MMGMIPQLTPILQLLGDGIELATTGNITNNFGYKVLNNDEMQAGIEYKVPKITGHFMRTIGLQNLVTEAGIEAVTRDKKSRLKEEITRKAESAVIGNDITSRIPYGTAMVTALADLKGIPFVTPVAKAFIKKSNLGLAEEYAKAGVEIDRVKAEKKIEVTKSIERYLDNDFTDQDVINILTYEGNAKKLLMNYTAQSPLVKSLSSETDPKKQALILNRYFKSVDNRQ